MAEGYGIGREATTTEILAWDIDVRPDGRGLPIGAGSVIDGEEIYTDLCAACHGDFGEGIGRWPELAGGDDTLDSHDPIKTIGSYWPYLSTVFDYVNRAMPFGYSQSLETDEVYAITAYLLYLNDLVDEEFELNKENFLDIRLTNEENFILDNRRDVEMVKFSVEPCMSYCKEEVTITKRARILDVTPEEETERSENKTSKEKVKTSKNVEEGESLEIVLSDEILSINGDPEYGKYLSNDCRGCHQEVVSGKGIPSLENLTEMQILLALHSYKNKIRNNPVMQMMAGRLSDEEIAALAAYFSKPK